MMADKFGFTEEDMQWIERLDEAAESMDRQRLSAQLWTAWKEGPYVARHKALELLGLTGDSQDARRLTDLVLDASCPEEFRLRALSALGKLRCEAVVCRLEPLFGDPNPFLPKGLVTVLGQIGGEGSLDLLLRFGPSPRGRQVKREIYQEAIALAVASWPLGLAMLAQRRSEERPVRLFLRGMDLEVPEIPRYSAFPANDYMAEHVKSRGLFYKRFKYLVEQ